VRLDRAIDRFDGELARRGCTKRSRADYRRKLTPLCDLLPDASVLDVTEDDCRAHLDRWRDRHPNTMRHSVSVLKSLFGWLYEIDAIPRNPMDRIKPPRRPNPDDLDVTTVSGADVRRLFDACETWTEFLCLATLAYLGPRRRAASNLRRRDVDLDRGTIRFREKGGKVITKPIPEEFADLLGTAIGAGAIGASPDSYVIPMPRGQRREGDRDDRIIWRTVKNLGKRAGVEVHPHALRAAFAVRFLESHPGEVEALQRLMGHSKMETTQIYLRRLDRERPMERVRDLSWGSPGSHPRR
jgi:integrase/recombinase XerD